MAKATATTSNSDEPKKQPMPAVIESIALQRVQPERVIAALAEVDAKGISPFDLAQIRVPGSGASQWLLEGKRVDHLDVILMHVHAGRNLYTDPYSAQNAKAPTCASYDGVTGYGDPGGDCLICPLGQFGGPCHPMNFAYCLFMDKTVPYLLTVPRTSLAPMRKYMTNLRLSGYPPSAVLSRLSLADRDKGEGVVIEFAMVGVLADEPWNCVKAYTSAFRASVVYPGQILGGYGVDPTALPAGRAKPQAQLHAGAQVVAHVCNKWCQDGAHVELTSRPAEPVPVAASGPEKYGQDEHATVSSRSQAEKDLFGDDDIPQ